MQLRQCGLPSQQRQSGALKHTELIHGTGCLAITVELESWPEFTAGEHVVLLYYGAEEAMYVYASISDICRLDQTIQLVLRMGEWPPIVPLLATLSPGAKLEIDAGHGEMVMPPIKTLQNTSHIILIGAGTGIVPLRCLLWHILNLEALQCLIHVLYSWNVSKYPNVLYHDEFLQLAQAGRIDYTCVWTGTTKLDQRTVDQTTKIITRHDDQCFVAFEHHVYIFVTNW